MYPILSVLRRCATSQIFVRTDQLENIDGDWQLRLQRDSVYWDFAKSRWSSTSNLAKISELEVTAASQESAAIALVEFENLAADSMQSTGIDYTLVMGPEEETEKDGQWIRKTRVAVIRGIFRASAGKEVAAVPLKTALKRTFGKLSGVAH